MRKGVAWGLMLCTVVGTGWITTAHATSLLPLVTESARPLPSGRAEITLGAAYFKDSRYPSFTPDGTLQRQTLVEGPQLGVRIGVGGWVELQASYELIYIDEETPWGQTNTHYGSGDARLATKLRLLRERAPWWRPGIGVHFGTKLPNAVRAERLGTDDTDFYISALVTKNLGPLVLHSNLGILLLGNSGSTIGHSFEAGGQDDLFTYRLAAVSHGFGRDDPGATRVHILGEFAGQSGSRYDNDRNVIRLGTQLARGNGALYLGASTGLTSGSETFGFSGGFIYTFRPKEWFGAD